MAKVGIIGCGYTGQFLVPKLLAAGHEVVATTTTEAKLDQLRALGAHAECVRLDQAPALKIALQDCTQVVMLAPPERGADVGPQAEALIAALPAALEVLVYGSTTGAFGNHANPKMWIDESTPSRNLGAYGQARFDFERAFRQAKLPLKVLRIAGIYGPGRGVLHALDRGMKLLEGGPATSRIHVEDLARLLVAMCDPEAPPMAVACDEAPTPTLEVARYACEVSGRPMPAFMTYEAAKAELSAPALEMRMAGRRCRSLVRAQLVGELTFPTYKEGLAGIEGEPT